MYSNNKPSLKPTSSQASYSEFPLQKSDFKTEYPFYEKLLNIKNISNLSPILQAPSQTSFP